MPYEPGLSVPLYQYAIVYRDPPAERRREGIVSRIKTAIRNAREAAHEWVEARRQPIGAQTVSAPPTFRQTLRYWWRIAPWTRIAEAFSGLSAIGWAVLLLCQTHLLEDGKALHSLTLDACAGVWGSFAAIVGVFWAVTLIYGNPTIRFCTSSASAVFWASVAIRLYRSSPHIGVWPINTGFVVYSLMSIMCAVGLFPLSKFVVAGVVFQYERVHLWFSN